MCLSNDNISLTSENVSLETLNASCSEATTFFKDFRGPIHFETCDDSECDDVDFDDFKSPLQCGDNEVFINPLLLEEFDDDDSSISDEDEETESLTFSITCHNDSKIIINPHLIEDSLCDSDEEEFKNLLDTSIEQMDEVHGIVSKANFFKTVATILYLLWVSLLLLSQNVSVEALMLTLFGITVLRTLIQVCTNSKVMRINSFLSHGVSFQIKKDLNEEKKSIWSFSMMI